MNKTNTLERRNIDDGFKSCTKSTLGPLKYNSISNRRWHCILTPPPPTTSPSPVNKTNINLKVPNFVSTLMVFAPTYLRVYITECKYTKLFPSLTIFTAPPLPNPKNKIQHPYQHI